MLFCARSSSGCWQGFQWKWPAGKHLAEQSWMLLPTGVSLPFLWLWSSVPFPWLESTEPLAGHAQEFCVNYLFFGRCHSPFSNSCFHFFLKRHSIFPWAGNRVFDLYQIVSFFLIHTGLVSIKSAQNPVKQHFSAGCWLAALYQILTPSGRLGF